MTGPDGRRAADRSAPPDRRSDQQLKTILLEEIIAGRYEVDEQLPTGHALCAQHGISRVPVLNRYYVRGLFAGATKG